MRIKRLEIQGFKSFKDRTVIHFDHAITGIVGPNGCGKSNIVDAVFWVMGEQSNKHIRAGGSQDLIFNGSSKHNPAAVAEVTMVLERSVVNLKEQPAGASTTEAPLKPETVEVSVTRRVYRDGEGEYLINGVTARLRDIHELFMDTGVGAKGYSIIAQGEIHRIVNAKPEERRGLIEEAAGIAKYKARKKEAERKLETAQGNLARLQDVLNEVERSTNSLERQAQKAQQYRSLKTELTTKELTWGKRKLALIDQKSEVAKKRWKEAQEASIVLRAKLSDAEVETETLRLKETELQPKAQQLTEVVADLQNEKSKLESDLHLAQARKLDASSRSEAFQEELSRIAMTLAEVEIAKEALGPEIEKRELKYRALEAQQTEVSREILTLRENLDSAQNQLQAHQKTLLSHMAVRSETKSKIERARLKLESLDRNRESLALKKEEVLSEKTDVDQELATSRIQLEDFSTKSVGLNSKIEELQNQLSTKQKEELQARNKLSELESALVKNKSRASYLETLLNSTDDLEAGTKALLKENKNLKTLNHYLKVEAGYERLVSIALGSWLESIPVESGQSLGDWLARLPGKTLAGSAHFMLAATQSPSVQNETATSTFKNLSQYIQVSDALSENVKHSLLNNLSQILVVESLYDALSLRDRAEFANNSRIKLATQDGFFFSNLNQVQFVGAQAQKHETLLTYRNELSSLQSVIADLDANLVALKQSHESIGVELTALSHSLNESKSEQSRFKAEIETLKSQIQREEHRLDKLNQRLEQSSREFEETMLQIEQAQLDHQNAIEQDQDNLERENGLQSQTQHFEDAAKTASQIYTEAQNKMTESQSALYQASTDLNQARTELRLLEQKFSSLSSRKQEIEISLSKLSTETENFQETETQSESRLITVKQSLEQQKGVLASYTRELEIIKNALSDFYEQTKSVRSALDKSSAQEQESSLDSERLETERSFLIKNLEEKHGPGCMDAILTTGEQLEMKDPVVTSDISESEEAELNEEVERLREKLRRLGDVNHNALEEYEREKARLDHLISEKKDLSDSIEDLLQAIEQINQSSVARFQKAFEAISSRFEKLFPIIFGGGQGKLSLNYPEGVTDIMEAGVEILAQPPGKKIVNMGLLSGGEKALTAVSFIFAIFLVKPSPFCILDEVDAPLDDANVGRFNALLREMSNKSQFIVITHNKKTMELNDALYGVTMEDPGVSKMVSIELAP